MNGRRRYLATRIRDELAEIERVAERVVAGWNHALRNADDYFLDSVALNLHGCYGGLERMFDLIATAIDAAKPKGEDWHQALLRQMTEEMPGRRPAVISQCTYNRLDEYRGFCYVVRNGYTFNFEAAQIQRLVLNLPATLDQTRAELLAFASFLEQQGQD